VNEENSGKNPEAEPCAEFVRLFTGVQRKLYSFLRAILRNPTEAEDVLQETNLVIWQKFSDFEVGTNFNAWAFSIARWQIMSHRKKQGRSKLHFGDELVERLVEQAPQEFESFDARKSALSECLKKLKPEQRQLVAQRYEPGGSVNEMAEEQGRSAKAVSEALRRIRKNLGICIENNFRREGFA